MNRETNIRNLNLNNIWDVVVIGGGASGLGVAVDSASRGYKTVLVEQSDFSKSTSSRSTKLVHGGVRYLSQGDVALVLDALKERGHFLKNVPHLVSKQEFVVPNYEWWDAPYYTIGLKMYDLMSGKKGFGKSEHINKEETIEKIPNLLKKELDGGVVYYDGQFDDSRMAVTLAQTLVDKGGLAINYMKVNKLIRNRSGMIKGVNATDLETGNEHKINSRVVVNATGVFSDNIIKMDDPAAEKTVVASQGVHLVVDKKFLGSSSALMIPKTSDGRVLFAVPWHDKTVIGTTDSPVDNVSLEPRAMEEEVEFILQTCKQYLKKSPERKDVLSVYAGLRPLVKPEKEDKKTKEISRDHTISVSLSGLVSIVGGKWTTYRKMGEDTMDTAIMIGGLKERPSVTAEMQLHAAMPGGDNDDHLKWYGADSFKIKAMIAENPKLGERIIENYPYTKAEVVWACREEMARNIEDFLARRIRLLFLDARAAIKASETVAKIMASELGYRRKWQKEQIESFNKLAGGYILIENPIVEDSNDE
ncbi:MAG: FAD-dependent oxidoreductase [Marinilabiliales bacterium]|nr:MAG: FAD-dependent oxidoreductase [Marinilabiliales bacterium]